MITPLSYQSISDLQADFSTTAVITVKRSLQCLESGVVIVSTSSSQSYVLMGHCLKHTHCHMLTCGLVTLVFRRRTQIFLLTYLLTYIRKDLMARQPCNIQVSFAFYRTQFQLGSDWMETAVLVSV